MGSVVLNGATSGATTITPTDAVTVTVTLPSTGGTLQTSGSGYTTNGVAYATSTSALATGSGLVFNGTNLGVGVTPSAWGSNYKAIQIGAGNGSISNKANGGTWVNYNAYNDNTNWLYGSTGQPAGLYAIINPAGSINHVWYTAPSGTAGNPITFNPAMTLDNSGNLLVGTTSAMNGIGSDGKSGFQADSLNIVVQNSGDKNIYLAKLSGYTESTFMLMSVNGTTVGTLATNGTGTILNVGTNGGVTFNNSSAVSSGNTLNDYEVGTWTPTWTGGGSLTGSFTYTKIGRVVYIDGQMNVFGTTSGDLGGLPFSSAADGRDCGSVGYQNVNGSTWNVLKISGTSFRFYAGGTQQQAASGSDIRFSFSYTTSF